MSMLIERNKFKMEFVTRLNTLKGHEACLAMVALIDILIEENRESNDHEPEIVQIYRNQGRISELISLKKFITDGYPKRPDFSQNGSSGYGR